MPRYNLDTEMLENSVAISDPDAQDRYESLHNSDGYDEDYERAFRIDTKPLLLYEVTDDKGEVYVVSGIDEQNAKQNAVERGIRAVSVEMIDGFNQAE